MATRAELIDEMEAAMAAIADAAQEAGGAYMAARLVDRMGDLETAYPNHLTDPVEAVDYLAGAQAALGASIAEMFEPNAWLDEFLGAIADGILLQSAGLDPHPAVRILSVANITLSGLQTIDGVTLVDGDRVGVIGQSAGAENGIWVAHAGAWTRAGDMDASGELRRQSFFAVTSGTLYEGSSWICTTADPIVIGTTATTWELYQSSLVLSAGNGLTRTGNVFDVGAGTGIQVNADSVQIDPAWIGQASITTLGTITTGVWNATVLGAAYGGTGLSAYTAGDLILASGTTTLAPLAANATGTRLFLTSVSSAVSYTALVDADIPNTLVRTSRSISTTAPLSGGGDLSSNRTLSIGGLTSIGGSNQIVGVNVGATGWEYKSLAGVNNRTIANYSPGSITIDIASNYAGQNTINTVGTITTGTWNGSPITTAYGGTGLSSFAVGDILYGAGLTTIALLAGNTSTQRRFLSQTGNGTVSAAPSWQAVTASDIPTANLAGTANQVSLSASGTGVLVGSTSITLSLPQNIHTGASPTWTGLTLSGLAGTGTRLTTSTSAGAQGNATTIDGNYTFNGTLTFSSPSMTYTANRVLVTNSSGLVLTSGNITWNNTTAAFAITGTAAISGNSTIGGTLSVANSATFSNTVGFIASLNAVGNSDNHPLIYGSAEGGTDPFNLNGHLILQGRTGGGSGRDIIFYTGTTPTIRYRLTTGGAHSFTGSVAMSSTLSVTGVQTNAQDLVFSASRTIRRDVQNSSLDFSGGNNSSDGANMALFGSTHATLANNWRIRHGSTNDIAYNGSSITITPPTVLDATLNVTGLQTNSEAIAFGANGTSGSGRIWRSAGGGLSLRGVAGSSNDVQILSAGSGDLFTNPTGTNNVVIAGSGGATTINGTLGVNGLVTASSGVQFGLGSSAAGKIFQTSVSGLAVRGITGSSYDFVIRSANDASNVLQVPAGTGNAVFPGSVTLSGAITTGLTASLPVFTNGSSQLTTNPRTGLGNVVMSTSPTLENGFLFSASSNFSILANTSDASDTMSIRICGGGGFLTNRGASLAIYGNEYASSSLDGNITLTAGNSTNGAISFFSGSSFTARYTLNAAGTHTFSTPVTCSDILYCATNVGIGSGASTPGYDLHIQKSSASGITAAIINTASGGSADAALRLQTDFPSFGEPRVTFSNTTYSFSVGIDTLFGTIFTIGRGGDLSDPLFEISHISRNVLIYTLAGTGTRLVTSTAGGTLGNATTIAGNYTFSGNLTLNGTNTLVGLAGTGTRLVTSTSTGVLGNATTVDGNYTFSGNSGFSENVTFSRLASGLNRSVVVSSVRPELDLYETDASVDEKYWTIGSSGGNFRIYSVDDAYSLAYAALEIRRTGATPTLLTTLCAVDFSYGLTAGNSQLGLTRITGQASFEAQGNFGAGGSGWSDETSIDVTGLFALRVTPTANNQTYRLINQSNGQLVFIENLSASHSIRVGTTTGDSDTNSITVQPLRGAIMRYDSTSSRWFG